VNKYRFRLGQQQTKAIEVPISIAWDLNGVNDSIDLFESDVIRQVINPIDDFETTRYSHRPFRSGAIHSNQQETSTNYEFYFYSATTDSNITGETTNNNWVTDYRANGISTVDVLYQRNVFKSSFFKLDFYDTKSSSNQQIYLTIIIPTHQGQFMPVQYGVSTVNIKKPVFNLDFVGDKEGYFIYWLKDTEFVDLKTLYMSAKFYDARIGQFKRMMTQGQGILSDKFRFNNEDYFYCQVDLNYDDYTYEITLTNPFVTEERVGTKSNPMKWYEYVNPPAPPIITNPTPTPTPVGTPNKFLVKRCSDDTPMYAVDTNNTGAQIGDFVRLNGASNIGCWEVVATTTVTGALIVSKHKDCSCS
jgi:hypothetical protein